MYPAHIRREFSDDGKKFYVYQSVAEHCRNTAKYVSEALKVIGLEKTAYLAGLLHDCGKLSIRFRKYIEDAVINEKNVQRGSVNHTFAGVKLLLAKHNKYSCGNDYKDLTIELLAYAIGAHHGLFDCIKDNNESAFTYRLQKENIDSEEAIENFYKECASNEEIEDLLEEATHEVSSLAETIISIDSCDINKESEIPFYYSLVCRLLTSAIIDADRRDTMEFEKNEVVKQVNTDWGKVLEKFDSYIGELKVFHDIDLARKEISRACAVAAKKPEGVYRLNVPTGGGKTLSSLRYALEHAKEYHKKRIFFVMPLLSIIEQNAKEIRKAIQDDSIILEHHSNVIQDENNDISELSKRELLIQSWNNPIVITTLVQLLNTMFLGKTSSVRRFASLCNSVIVFDEVQSIPNKMLTLFNLTINFLVKKCHATVILCSATQPSFENAEHKLVDDVSDLINLSPETLRFFKRVELVDMGSMEMTELTDFALEIITSKKSLLLVCNTKREAKELFENLQAEVNGEIPIYHISASMCTEHRKLIVESMKSDLEFPKPKQIVCVATQVIEAGVDISFNCVIRLQAGMDSIVQAAGRCNRNGENILESVYIVNLLGEKLHHLKDIDKAKIATDALLQKAKTDKQYASLLSDVAISFYYKKLYAMMEDGEQGFWVPALHKSLYKLLNQHNVAEGYFLAQQLKTAGIYFNVFDNNTEELLVPYGKGREIISELNSGRAMYDIAYAEEVIKKATGYTVTCYQYQLDILKQNTSVIYNDYFNIYILDNYAYYDEKLGLNLDAIGGDGIFY